MTIDRVPDQKVVSPAPLVISIDNPDAIFLKDNPKVVFTTQSGTTLPNVQIGAFAYSGVGGVATAGVPFGTTNLDKISDAVVPDVPSLSDIESIIYEEYADANGVAKYKAVIKIRNSSKNKLNVLGVDARIYNPNGSNLYTLGSGNASSGLSGSNASAYISNTTWYKATASYNPFSGYVVSLPAISINAQYLADGSNVPKDSITGISTNIRMAEAWRKTENDALAAVTALYSKYVI